MCVPARVPAADVLDTRGSLTKLWLLEGTTSVVTVCVCESPVVSGPCNPKD